MKCLSLFLLLIINITVISTLPREVKIKPSPDLKTFDAGSRCVQGLEICQTASDCCPPAIPGISVCCEYAWFMEHSICVSCSQK